MEAKELKEQLTQIEGMLATKFAEAAKQQEAHGAITSDLKSKLEALQKQYDALDSKLAAKHAATEILTKSIVDDLREDEQVARLVKDKKGTAFFRIKGANAARLWESKSILRS